MNATEEKQTVKDQAGHSSVSIGQAAGSVMHQCAVERQENATCHSVINVQWSILCHPFPPTE